jgi:hypothetical protein
MRVNKWRKHLEPFFAALGKSPGCIYLVCCPGRSALVRTAYMGPLRWRNSPARCRFRLNTELLRMGYFDHRAPLSVSPLDRRNGGSLRFVPKLCVYRVGDLRHDRRRSVHGYGRPVRDIQTPPRTTLRPCVVWRTLRQNISIGKRSKRQYCGVQVFQHSIRRWGGFPCNTEFCHKRTGRLASRLEIKFGGQQQYSRFYGCGIPVLK